MSDDISNAPIFSGAAAPKAREFEFGPAENQVFTGLAAAMRFVGGGSVALAAVMLLSAIAGAGIAGVRGMPYTLGQAVGAAVLGISGVWLRGAARSIEAIVSTEGRDVAHLMGAMRDLAQMFTLQRTVLIVSFVVGALALVASVVAIALNPTALSGG